MKMLFYPAYIYPFSDEEKDEFNKIYEDALHNGGLIKYESSYPKFRFLQYLSANKNVLFHGSNNKEINEFYPRRQTLFNGKYVEAVFSTSDGIWPIFYAVFNRNKRIGNFRNGCFESKGRTRFYFFSLTKETIENAPWTEGIVYVLPREAFRKVGKGPITFDEWICHDPVQPILKLEVDTRDFVFYDKVSTHKSHEKIIKTWILYKFRTKH